MPIIKKLKLKLKSGLLSELQSDTIYGHFCWRLKEQLGEDKLAEFLQCYREDKPVFTLSNGLIENFLKHKEIKTKKFITLEQLNLFLNGETIAYEDSFEKTEIKSLRTPRLMQDLRVSVEIDRNTFSHKEGQLFSYNPFYVDDEEDQTFFIVLIKILDAEKFISFQCEEMLKSVFETGFGKKKSSGYGQFEVLDLTDYSVFKDPKETDGFLTLGNYLPSANDKIEDGYYEFNVKYGRLGESYSQGTNPFKRPIILFQSGSCFLSKVRNDYYGRMTNRSEITDYKPNVVQIGMPFTLNFYHS
jgi:CRISPR-associated protein Csm4